MNAFTFSLRVNQVGGEMVNRLGALENATEILQGQKVYIEKRREAGQIIMAEVYAVGLDQKNDIVILTSRLRWYDRVPAVVYAAGVATAAVLSTLAVVGIIGQ